MRVPHFDLLLFFRKKVAKKLAPFWLPKKTRSGNKAFAISIPNISFRSPLAASCSDSFLARRQTQSFAAIVWQNSTIINCLIISDLLLQLHFNTLLKYYGLKLFFPSKNSGSHLTHVFFEKSILPGKYADKNDTDRPQGGNQQDIHDHPKHPAFQGGTH